MSSRRSTLAVLAAGLVGAVLPAVPAHASVVPAKPQFGGFTTTSTATPLKLEVYEPTIPIPASPQAEVDFAYTKTQSATGPNADGRASWLWPGDPVGEGFKTFVEQLGLPPQLGEGGYRVQVNSSSPGGPESQSDEPVPGTVMRTSASPDMTVAEAGYSPDGKVSDRDPNGGGGAPGVPSPPGAPVPAPGDLSSLGAAITGRHAASAGSPASPGSPQELALPPQVAALVDMGGMTSISRSVTKGDVIKAYATSKLADLSLLSGLITADSVKVAAVATSDGRKGTTDGGARVVGLAIAGNQFTVDRDGVHAAGRQAPIPGLPDDPAKALDQLGISFVLPKGQRSTQGADAQAGLQGLQIVIDTQVLRSKLDGIPFDEIVNQVPDQAGKLKSVLGALVHVAPKLVITAGGATTDVSTVPAIALPDLGAVGAPATVGGAGVSGGSLGGSSGTPAAGGAPGAGALGGASPGSSPATGVATRNAAAGLPPLSSVPGALLVGGLLLASGLGWWLQRIGAFVIGGAGSCSHGLETGVPDLRKA